MPATTCDSYKDLEPTMAGVYIAKAIKQASVNSAAFIFFATGYDSKALSTMASNGQRISQSNAKQLLFVNQHLRFTDLNSRVDEAERMLQLALVVKPDTNVVPGTSATLDNKPPQKQTKKAENQEKAKPDTDNKR